MEVRIGQLKQLLKVYLKKGVPPMVHGPPGIGKSDSVRVACREYAKQLGLEFEEGIPSEENVNKFVLCDQRVSQMDPSDLRGIPWRDGDRTRWLAPNWLPTKGQGCLFFDEINLAAPSVQASLYQLILDKRLGDYVLPEGWAIIAAGNRAIDKANVFPMAAPLKNRFSHCTLVPPSGDEWIDWALANNIRSDIIAFIAFKPSLLYKFDATSKDDAFATPRMWARASYLTLETDYKIKGEGKNDILEEEFLLVASCVGEGVALEYQGFIRLKNKVKIEDILNNPEKVAELVEPGIAYSLASGLAERYKSKKKDLNRILAVVGYMKADIAGFMFRLMRKMKPNEFVNDMMSLKEWDKLSAKYSTYFL